MAGNVSPPTVVSVTYVIINPVNDLFANSIPLAGNSGTVSAITTNATKEVGEPFHAGNAGGKSVWWSFQSPTDGALTLSTTNSTFDTVLGLYAGGSVSALTTIASNDDAYDGVPGGNSRIVQAVRSNQTYRIAVDGYNGEGGVAQLSYSFTTGKVYTLTVNTTGSGSVSPGTMDVSSNATVLLAATPAANNQFDIWSGPVTSLANPLSLTVRSNLTVTANFRPADFTDGFETGNLLHLAWVTAGNQPWTVQTNIVAAGSFAARSGIINKNQSSALLLTGSFRAGNGSFDYRVSSELDGDFLRFFVDGLQIQQWSGEVPWANFTFPLTAGTHTLEWRYSTDPSFVSGLDAAFLDDVILPLAVGADSSTAAHLQMQRATDGSFFVDLTGQANQQYILQISTNLVNWQSVSTNIASGGFLRLPDPTGATNRIQFYRAVVQLP